MAREGCSIMGGVWWSPLILVVVLGLTSTASGQGMPVTSSLVIPLRGSISYSTDTVDVAGHAHVRTHVIPASPAGHLIVSGSAVDVKGTGIPSGAMYVLNGAVETELDLPGSLDLVSVPVPATLVLPPPAQCAVLLPSGACVPMLVRVLIIVTFNGNGTVMDGMASFETP